MPKPTDIRLHTRSRQLELEFDDGFRCLLSAEFLRVHSPSAEVRGHGPGQEVLQVGKEEVGIEQITPAGHYAIKLHFDDGHATGLYTWDYLYELGQAHDAHWQRYLERLAAAGHRRRETPVHD